MLLLSFFAKNDFRSSISCIMVYGYCMIDVVIYGKIIPFIKFQSCYSFTFGGDGEEGEATLHISKGPLSGPR